MISDTLSITWLIVLFVRLKFSIFFERPYIIFTYQEKKNKILITLHVNINVHLYYTIDKKKKNSSQNNTIDLNFSSSHC